LNRGTVGSIYRKEFQMTQQTVAIKDIYTRKVGGEQYEYEVKYSPGERVEWSARVYRGNVLKGTPGGVESENHLEGEALRESIVTLVEVAIEGMQGITE
jgi:hypothetical protein